MNIGAIFPTTEIGNDLDAIRDWPQAVEFGGERLVGYAGPRATSMHSGASSIRFVESVRPRVAKEKTRRWAI